MIPTNIDPFWYDAYWYGVPEIRRRYWRGAPQRDLRRHPPIDPAPWVAGLLLAALLVGAALLALYGPTPPVDAPYFVT
jgi:hypothetical protein